MSHRLTAQAEADLDDIWAYIVSESGNTEIARRQLLPLQTDSSCFPITHGWDVRAILTWDLGDEVILWIGMSSSTASKMRMSLFFAWPTAAGTLKRCSSIRSVVVASPRPAFGWPPDHQRSNFSDVFTFNL